MKAQGEFQLGVQSLQNTRREEEEEILYISWIEYIFLVALYL